jgi:hypothetical protein
VLDPLKLVKFRDWKCYIEQYFRPTKRILGDHNFRVSAECLLGLLNVKSYNVCNSIPLCENFLKDQSFIPYIIFHQEIPAPGFEPERHNDIYTCTRNSMNITLISVCNGNAISKTVGS